MAAVRLDPEQGATKDVPTFAFTLAKRLREFDAAREAGDSEKEGRAWLLICALIGHALIKLDSMQELVANMINEETQK